MVGKVGRPKKIGPAEKEGGGYLLDEWLPREMIEDEEARVTRVMASRRRNALLGLEAIRRKARKRYREARGRIWWIRRGTLRPGGGDRFLDWAKGRGWFTRWDARAENGWATYDGLKGWIDKFWRRGILRKELNPGWNGKLPQSGEGTGADFCRYRYRVEG